MSPPASEDALPIVNTPSKVSRRVGVEMVGAVRAAFANFGVGADSAFFAQGQNKHAVLTEHLSVSEATKHPKPFFFLWV